MAHPTDSSQIVAVQRFLDGPALKQPSCSTDDRPLARKPSWLVGGAPLRLG